MTARRYGGGLVYPRREYIRQLGGVLASHQKCEVDFEEFPTGSHRSCLQAMANSNNNGEHDDSLQANTGQR